MEIKAGEGGGIYLFAADLLRICYIMLKEKVGTQKFVYH